MTTLVETAMSPLQPTLPQITVLGIGNLLWADEGFGVRCVEALQQRYEFADNVALIDGGTQGLYLIQHVQQADYLLIFDAVDYNLAPGELKFIADDEVPKFLGIKKLSLHQTGFQEVLMLAQLTGHYPTRVLLIGCQPENMMDYGGSLRPSVRAAMEGALDEALRVLDSWGAAPHKRGELLLDFGGVLARHGCHRAFQQAAVVAPFAVFHIERGECLRGGGQ